MLDDHAGAGTLEKDVGHDVFVDLYESFVLISRKAARLEDEAPDDTLLARASCLRRWGLWVTGMPPQAWT